MKVRIKGDISGSRNGVPWPKRGEVIDLPDDEATGLCRSGLAVPVTEVQDDVEEAVPAADAETRGGLTKETASGLTTDAPSGDPQAADGPQQTTETAPETKQASEDTKPAAAKKTAAKRTPAKPQTESK
ncbi:hypothetical protein [Streptomyces sp. NPDC094468]|uniref:hypothetical protein n=1 Tax=Streptomyces sp. NPDC094468 TaxID=3366066 RepID=UPI0038011CB8